MVGAVPARGERDGTAALLDRADCPVLRARWRQAAIRSPAARMKALRPFVVVRKAGWLPRTWACLKITVETRGIVTYRAKAHQLSVWLRHVVKVKYAEFL
jgi:hypothetical protein